MTSTRPQAVQRTGARVLWRRACLPSGAVAVAACIAAMPPRGTADDATEFAQTCVRFQEALDAARTVVGFPGATAAFVLADGRSAAFATGWSDVEAGTPMTPRTRSMSGSVGKTFVAAVVLSLVHEGRLSLDDRIATWLGDEAWFHRLPNGPAITVRHLLTHSSGLTDHVYSAGFAAAVAAQLAQDQPDPDWRLTPREEIAFVLDRPPLFPAGEGYAYTDTGYLLVGLIVEEVTGAAYYDELQRRFLDPLELRLTGPSNRRDLPGLTPGYLAADNPLGLPRKTMLGGELLFTPAMEWTGGGLVTNAHDLARWAKALYEGQALSQPYIGELLSGVARSGGDTKRYGLGAFIDETPFGPAYGHDGWFPGYSTVLRYYPGHRIAVAMQVNTDTVDEGLHVGFDALVRALVGR